MYNIYFAMQPGYLQPLEHVDIYTLKTLQSHIHVDGARTLQERMLPKAEKVSYSALLSMDLSRFLMNTLPTPDFLREGSLWDHMIRIGLPLTTSKFMVSKALSADRREKSNERFHTRPRV